ELDRTEWAASARLFYVVSPKLSLFAEPYFRNIDYLEDDPVTRDSQVWGVLGGATFDFNGIIFGEVGIGTFEESFEESSFGSFSGLALQGAVDWNVTQLTTISAMAARNTEATTVAGATGKVRTLASVSVEHELYRDTLVRLGGGVQLDSFEALDREDTTVMLDAGVRYFINRNLSVY